MRPNRSAIIPKSIPPAAEATWVADPINPAMRLKLAEDYGIAGDSAKAAQLYRELLKNTPDLPGLRERVRARLADIYLRGSDQKRAAAPEQSYFRATSICYWQCLRSAG